MTCCGAQLLFLCVFPPPRLRPTGWYFDLCLLVTGGLCSADLSVTSRHTCLPPTHRLGFTSALSYRCSLMVWRWGGFCVQFRSSHRDQNITVLGLLGVCSKCVFIPQRLSSNSSGASDGRDDTRCMSIMNCLLFRSHFQPCF